MPDWNERYRQGEHTSDEPHSLVIRFASGLNPGRALDLACGAGRHAIWLAERGWRVTAVDYSAVAIDIVRERAQANNVSIDCHVADLERHEFVLEPRAYDLIVVCNYLQRDLFASIREATRIGGLVIAVIAMVDNGVDPNIGPMNPAYLVRPGELRAQFEGWDLISDSEVNSGPEHRRPTAEIVARRLS